MADGPAGLPIELIHKFWEEVEQILRERHGLATDDALRAIVRFRNTIDRVGPLVYHRGASYIADAIIAGGYAERRLAAS